MVSLIAKALELQGLWVQLYDNESTIGVIYVARIRACESDTGVYQRVRHLKPENRGFRDMYPKDMGAGIRRIFIYMHFLFIEVQVSYIENM